MPVFDETGQAMSGFFHQVSILHTAHVCLMTVRMHDHTPYLLGATLSSGPPFLCIIKVLKKQMALPLLSLYVVDSGDWTVWLWICGRVGLD